jgi:hypothetical protein
MDYGFPSWDALKQAVVGKEGQTTFLHRLCGDLAAETLRRSGVPGRVRVWYDPLCEGPVPAGISGDQWFSVRGSTVIDRIDTLANAVRFFREMYGQLEEYPG